jgi:hypothetical protein
MHYNLGNLDSQELPIFLRKSYTSLLSFISSEINEWKCLSIDITNNHEWINNLIIGQSKGWGFLMELARFFMDSVEQR